MPITLMLHGKHQLPNYPPVAYEPFGPWLVPWRFGDLSAEYRAIRHGTGIVDFSTQALIECRGADRAGFLHRLLTNDIKRLSPGAGCRAALLTDTGKLIAELLILADADATWLLCDLTAADLVAQTLEKYHITEDLTITNLERAQALLALEGPDSLARIRRMTGSPALLPEPFTHTPAFLGDVSFRAIRHSALSSGVWCLVDARHAETFWRSLIASEIPPIGWEAFNTARLEAGTPLFGIDMDGTNLLPETGVETALCSETKGCYMGQEIIARMATYGSANKKLMGLLLEGDDAPRAGDRILRKGGGDEVGWVTSGTVSQDLKRPIALGYIKRGAYEAGTQVEIVRGAARTAAVVAARPLTVPETAL